MGLCPLLGNWSTWCGSEIAHQGDRDHLLQHLFEAVSFECRDFSILEASQPCLVWECRRKFICTLYSHDNRKTTWQNPAERGTCSSSFQESVAVLCQLYMFMKEGRAQEYLCGTQLDNFCAEKLEAKMARCSGSHHTSWPRRRAVEGVGRQRMPEMPSCWHSLKLF